MRRHRRFVLLLVLFVAGVLAQQAALPALEGSDEPLHTTYVETLRATGSLPDRATFRSNSTRQESGQPPLTYWLAAGVANLLNFPTSDPDTVFAHLQTVRNTWLTPPDAWNRRDNLNHYLHGRDERALGLPDVVTTNRVLRLTSVVYGVLAVIGAYGAAREVFRREAWALTATAVFAFMPTMLHISSYLTNDISAIALATLAVWAVLRLLRLGASPVRLLVLGALLALGGLSKISVLLVAPGVGVALLLDWQARRYSFGRFIANGLLLGLPLIALFGPWVAWGWINYGDPFGFNTHLHPTLSYRALLTLPELLRLMPEIYLSYWAKFGLAKIYLHPVTYTALGLILALALVGYALRGRTSFRMSLPVRQTLVLLVVFLVVLAGLVRWTQEIAIITGRLLYPAHIVVAIGLTGGLYQLARRFPALDRSLRLYAVGLLAASGLIYAPLAIHEAYMPPPLLARDQLPTLQGGPVDYEDAIRLLGYHQQTPVLSGESHVVTLCWEVLQPTERRSAFSLKFVREGVIVADRTSYHGLGHYDSSQWRPGDIFCDDVQVPFDDPDVQDDPLPQPGTAYDMLVVLLDARTREVDWTPRLPNGRAIQFPFVGQVVQPAGDLSAHIEGDLTPAAIDFPGFAALDGYRLDGDPAPGTTLDLQLLWRVTGSTPDSWTQFIHLAGPGESQSLADSPPRSGAYPTWAWSSGERVADHWSLALPSDLPPGEYMLSLGFYRQDSGQRMPVTANGAPAPDDAAPLLTFVVE